MNLSGVTFRAQDLRSGIGASMIHFGLRIVRRWRVGPSDLEGNHDQRSALVAGARDVLRWALNGSLWDLETRSAQASERRAERDTVAEWRLRWCGVLEIRAKMRPLRRACPDGPPISRAVCTYSGCTSRMPPRFTCASPTRSRVEVDLPKVEVRRRRFLKHS
jgi:hypothetical protein